MTENKDALITKQEIQIQTALKEFVAKGGTDTSLYDNAIAELYEILGFENVNKNGTSPIVQIYARRVLNGEITIEQVPAIIRPAVKSYIQLLNVVEINATIENGTIYGYHEYTLQIPRNQEITINFQADETYALPTLDNMHDYIIITCFDDKDKEIKDYAKEYIGYGATIDLAIIHINLTDDIKKIKIKITCQPQSNEKGV